MRRTTTRRATSTGLGVLAATTALALAAPAASAATSTVELDPLPEDVFLSLSAYPTSDFEDDAPVPSSGEVTIALPSLAVPSDDLAAAVYERADYEESFDDEDLVPLATTEDTPAFTVATGEDGLTSLDVVLPVEVFEERSVDDVVVLVEGVVVDGFSEGPVLDFTVEATPSTGSGRDDVVPLTLAAELFAGAEVDDVVDAVAGEAFELVLPEQSTLTDLGVTSLEDALVTLYPYDEGDFAWVAEEGDADEEALPGSSAAAEAAATALAAGADADEAVEAADVVDAEDLQPDVEVGEDGRTALVTPSEDLDEGDYLLELLLPSAGDDAVLTVVFGDVDLAAAAAPEPTPTVTVTQPAPTVTVAPRQNPGLRSNTGVEGAAPGLVDDGLPDGALVTLGSGLLAVAGVTAAVAARSSRRRARA